MLKTVLSKLCYYAVITSCLVFYFSGTVPASSGLFDGKRKGFILAIDVEPQIRLSRGSNESSFYSSGLFNLNIEAGYGFSEQLLYYARPYANFGVGLNEDEDRWTGLGGGVGLMYFPISGLNVYLQTGLSLSGSISIYQPRKIANIITPAHSVGGGVEGGIGLELFPHWTVGISLYLSRQWSWRSGGSDGHNDNIRFSIKLARLFY